MSVPGQAPDCVYKYQNPEFVKGDEFPDGPTAELSISRVVASTKYTEYLPKVASQAHEGSRDWASKTSMARYGPQERHGGYGGGIGGDVNDYIRSA